MIIVQFASALCQFSCYFLLGSMITGVFGANISLVMPALFLCAVSYTLQYVLRKLAFPIRVLSVLPYAAMFIFANTLSEYLLLAPPAVMLIVFCSSRAISQGMNRFVDFSLDV